MLKDECETALRHLFDVWRKETAKDAVAPNALSFTAFYYWVADHYPRYLAFRSVRGPREDAELWFDQEVRQFAAPISGVPRIKEVQAPHD